LARLPTQEPQRRFVQAQGRALARLCSTPAQVAPLRDP
jgi:hypothetical protein